MTLPNGSAGLATIGLEFAFTNDGSIPGAPDRTQPNITEILKAQMQDSEGWLGAHSVAYAGLPEGVPLILGLLMKIVEQVTGLPVVEWGSAGLEIIDDVFGAIGTFFSRITSLFPSLDFMLEGDWNPIDAIIDWITEDLLPLGLFMGFDSPLDASKLFGLIPNTLLGMIPFSHIGDAQPELLIAPTMDYIENVVGGGAWTWDGTTGHTTNGCVKTTANGSERVLLSNEIRVAPGQKLDLSTWAKWSGLTYTGTPIRLQVKRYMKYVPVGVEDIASPPSPATNQVTWVQFGDDNYEVPGDCDMLVVVLYVSATATAGQVWFDDASAKMVGLLKIPWIDGLIDDLASKLGLDVWIDHLETLFSDPGALIDSIPKSLVDGLEDAFQEMVDIFSGLVIDPVTTIGGVFEDFFGLFFRGGAKQVVTQDRIAEPSGIPPMDSAVKIPWVYLPPELMTTALGMPWVQADKSGSNQNITASTTTLLTNWNQVADQPTVLTFSGNKFTLPFDGMWMLEFQIRLSSFSAAEGGRITVEQNAVEIRRKSFPGVDTVDICFPTPAATTDEFGVFIFTPHGSKQVLTAGTYIRATYMGMTTVPSLPPAPDPVMFDAIGAGAHGADDGQGWNHTFGDGNTIVIPISHGAGGDDIESVTVGPYTVPILSGSTNIGNYFGFTAKGALAAAILPEAVRHTTRNVQVNFSEPTASACNSISFKNVGSLGAVITSGGHGGVASLNVPSNASSMLAVGFFGMDVAFGAFNRTEAYRRSFVAGQHWASVLGYGPGGGLLTCASSGKWHAKGIELHP